MPVVLTTAVGGGYSDGYPFLVVGMVKLVRLRAPGRQRDGMLDAAAMTTVMAWLVSAH